MQHIQKEFKFASNNYKSIARVMIRGKGIYVYDETNTAYMDCISGYSALNQGHCHPQLVKEMKKQVEVLTLTSRAYHNNKLGKFSQNLCETFDYEKVLLMNGGVEAGESATKIARAWGYTKKGVPENHAINVFFNNNFWGRSLAACSSSNDPYCYKNFGPYTQGFHLLEYNNIKHLEQFLKFNPNTVSVMLEPIQGEGGIIIPESGYLNKVRELCTKYNVLMIVDEIQTGLGRTGKMLACDYENVKPDILCLGKALSGGFYPISAVLSNEEIMSVLTPGTHGSTYGGNPLACAVGIKALEIIKKEKMAENAYEMGELFRSALSRVNNRTIKEIRGRGLLNGIEFTSAYNAERFVDNLLEKKILAKTTRNTVVRLTPPLTINKREINILINKIKTSLEQM